MSVYIVWGHPGQGKSYSCTFFAIDAMRKGKPVFSNYPIVTPDGKSTMKWKPEYASLPHPPTNAVIVVDEAYRDYNSRKYQNFSTEEHTYFATNRHNNLDIYLVAQNPARLDVTIREISQFILCKKLGFMGLVLGFKLEYFEFLEDLSRRKAGDKQAHYKVEYLLFRRKVAKSYDTKYYGINSAIPFKGELWQSVEGDKHTGGSDNQGDLESQGVDSKGVEEVDKSPKSRMKREYDLFEKRGFFIELMEWNLKLWKPLLKMVRLVK